MTNAELAILSLIAEQPRHGYEIEQVIEERRMREWTEIGFTSIYYLLPAQEAGTGGLIEGQLEEAERGPAREAYHLTPAGGMRCVLWCSTCSRCHAAATRPCSWGWPISSASPPPRR